MTRPHSHFAGLVALSVALPFCGLSAQEAASTVALESTDPPVSRVTETVTVIGEALPDAQNKPVSASLLSEEDIASFHIGEPQDIVRFLPNISATDSGSRSFGDVYSVRGLTNTVFFGSPSATVYVDDVPFGETFTYAQRLSAISSVEVLRGPQPTVVGRNTYGGLINIRSRRPTNEYEGALNYSYGSYEAHAADGWVMGPIADDVLFFRLGGQFDSREGYLWNPSTMERVDDQQHWGINGGLFWKPADGWEVSLTAAYDEYDDGAPRLTSIDNPNFYEVRSDVAGEQRRRTDNQALRISYESDKWRFLSVTSRRFWELNPYVIDLDFTEFPFGSSTITQEQEIWSQEFRFSSNDKDSPFQWNLGAYGSTGEIHGTGLRNIFTQQQTVTVTDITSDIASEIPLPVRLPRVLLTSISDSDIFIEQLTRHSIKEDAVAFYAGGSWSGWEPFTLHAGVRFDWVRREMERTKTNNTDAITNTTFLPLDPIVIDTGLGFSFPVQIPPFDPLVTNTRIREKSPRQKLSDEWVHLTPTVGFDIDITDHVKLYAKTTYAFKPGGFSAYVDDVRYARFEEERVWSSEIGLKTSALDDRLLVNLAAFYNDIDNYQVERSINITDYAVFNAAKAETYGAEFESKLSVLPVLDLYGSFGWTHARLKNYRDPVSGQNLDGKIPPFVPEFDATVAAEFHLEAGFFARVEYVALGNVLFDDFNRTEFKQSSFGLLNAAVGWRTANWSIALYGTNLNGEEYYTMMNPEVRTGAPGAPTEYGVRVGLRF